MRDTRGNFMSRSGSGDHRVEIFCSVMATAKIRNGELFARLAWQQHGVVTKFHTAQEKYTWHSLMVPLFPNFDITTVSVESHHSLPEITDSCHQTSVLQVWRGIIQLQPHHLVTRFLQRHGSFRPLLVRTVKERVQPLFIHCWHWNCWMPISFPSAIPNRLKNPHVHTHARRMGENARSRIFLSRNERVERSSVLESGCMRRAGKPVLSFHSVLLEFV